MIPYFASAEEIKNLNWEQSQNVLKGFGRITMTSFVKGCMNLLYRQGSDNYQYRKSGFNAVGDEVSHLALSSGTDMHNFTSSGMEASLDSTFLDEFAADVHDLERHGVRVIVLPPAIYDAGYNLKTTAIAEIAEALSERGVSFRAETKRFAYPVDMMYNTEYHLNKTGTNANTRNVIESLRSLLY